LPPNEHKTGKRTGKARVIYLSPVMVSLTERLMREYPEGPLFRSFRGGKPYTAQAVRCRFRRLRERVPALANVVCYTLRHTYATDALVHSVPIATVAELMGHTSTTMIARHYGHLAERTTHLRESAGRLSRGECT
jgi:integrase